MLCALHTGEASPPLFYQQGLTYTDMGPPPWVPGDPASLLSPARPWCGRQKGGAWQLNTANVSGLRTYRTTVSDVEMVCALSPTQAHKQTPLRTLN